MDALEEKNPILESGRRKSCHHQFLTPETGLTHLKGHLFMLTKLMKSSKTWEEFMGNVDALLPHASTDDIEISGD